MKFDNAAFNNGVSQTMGILGKLKSSLNFSDSKKGLDDLQSSADRFNLNGLSSATGGISKSFIAMSTVAITAISNITNKAVDAGVQLAKSITTDPIKAGYQEYVTNLNSIQTILANTKASGATLDDVNGALANLNHYSDKTIYNFSEMARNIGTFTAAGVDLDTSVNSIKGIANLAALSGSNSQQASTAMYQLSQAISAGRVGLQDWNSVVNAGMGGATFQRALAQTAAAMGTLDKSAVKLSGPMKNVTISGQSFRQSITAKPGEQSWLTSKVLTNTLQQFTGDLSDAQLKAQGFNDAQIKAIQQTAKTAQNAATKVKSVTQLIDVAKETVGSGWAKTWQLVFGDFKESRQSFTAASNTINGFLNRMSNARNHILKDWKALGGRTVLIDSIKNAFHALGAIIEPIKAAFEDIFPPMTGKRLFAMTKALYAFTAKLTITRKTSDALSRTFRGIFAVFDILWQIIKGVAGVFGDLFGVIGSGSGGFLQFTAHIGDMLVAFDDAIKKGDGLNKFFDGLSSVLQVPIKLIQALVGFVADLFSGFDGGGADKFASSMGNVSDRLSPLADLGKRIHDAFSGLSSIFSGITDALRPLGDAIGKALSGVGKALVDAFSGGNLNDTLDVINTGLLAAITLAFRKFVKGGFGLNIDIGSGGMFDSIKGAFDSLSGSLKTMQANVQADTLKKIAIAVGILAVSMVALSLIDSAKLTKALTAMSVGFGQLLGALYILTKISGAKGIVRIPALAASLAILAGALLILTASVAILAHLSWEELAKGLGGVAAALGILVAASKPLSANYKGMIRAGLGITALSAGMLIMSSAVKVFATMSWGDLARGLTGMSVALVAVAAAMNLMPASSVLTGPAFVAIAAGLVIMSGALKVMGTMSWESIAKSLVALAGALITLAAGLTAMVASLPGAAALVVAAAGIALLAGALQLMGTLSWESVAKSMVTLAGSLVILAAGLTLMIAALPGAAALVVAAGALALLAPVLVTLGSMSWESILKGLVTLAGIFVILGAAGIVLGPLVPAILGLGAALLLLGAGIALAGAGILAFATAFGILATAGAAGVSILIGAVSGLIQQIPAMMKALAQGLVGMAQVIIKGAPAFVGAFVAILNSLLNAVIKVTPKIGKAFMVLLNTALRILRNAIPNMIRTGFDILMAFLRGIANNIGRIVGVVSDIIVRFLNALGDRLPKIVQAGFNLLIKFMDGIGKAVNKNSERMGRAGADLAKNIVAGMVKGLWAGLKDILDAAAGLAHAALKKFTDIFQVFSPSRATKKIGGYVSEGLAIGIHSGAKGVADSAGHVAGSALDVMKTTMGKVADLASQNIDMSPVVAPVLDLTHIQKNASQINGLLGVKPISAGVSYSQASGVSSDVIKAAQEAAAAAEASTPASQLKFEQTINSPKALSDVEIYRSTRSLISLAKEALTP